jgi:hypothetical protein
MAEAVGVVSNVVGIISFGIQVAQGLLRYYASWKDQDQDIADMCASLESLLGTLTVLSKNIQPPTTFDRSVTENVERNVGRTKLAMNKLADELGQALGLGVQKYGARALMRRHVRQALYPFREQTLLKIRQSVSEARSNLDAALQTLQLLVASVVSRTP